MARRTPPVVVVCTNVAQAGRLAQDLGTRRGQEGHDHHHDHHELSGPRSTRRGQKGHHHDHHDHHELSGPRSTRHRQNGHHDPHHDPHARSGPRSLGASRSSAARVWKVYEGETLYEVRDLGTRIEARSEHGGSAVWTAVRLPSGEYDTQSTAFSTHELVSFLEKVHDGDQITPGARERPVRAQRAAPASAERRVQPPPASRARSTTQTPAPKTHHEEPRAEQRATAPKKRGRPKKVQPAASAPPKSKAAASAPPKSKAAASAPKPTSKQKAKRQPAARATPSGPSTSRSPGTEHETPASMRRRLRARDPKASKGDLTLLEDIWRGGASEPTRAWMLANGFTDLAEAFVDWVEHHTAEANGFMQAAHALRSA